MHVTLIVQISTYVHVFLYLVPDSVTNLHFGMVIQFISHRPYTTEQLQSGQHIWKFAPYMYVQYMHVKQINYTSPDQLSSLIRAMCVACDIEPAYGYNQMIVWTAYIYISNMYCPNIRTMLIHMIHIRPVCHTIFIYLKQFHNFEMLLKLEDVSIYYLYVLYYVIIRIIMKLGRE